MAGADTHCNRQVTVSHHHDQLSADIPVIELTGLRWCHEGSRKVCVQLVCVCNVWPLDKKNTRKTTHSCVAALHAE